MTVPLPEKGDGTRRRRRRDRHRSVRRNVVRAVFVLGGVAVVAGLVWAIVGLVGSDDGNSPTDASGDGSGSVDDLGPALVVLTDDAGSVYGITILAASAATIIHVPPGTMVEAPSLGLVSLRDAARDGGVELLQHSLENMMGVTFVAAATVAPPDLAAMVSSVQQLSVTIDEPVEERDPSGRVNVVVAAGQQTLAPGDALRFLSATGDGSSLQRLVRHQAFWTAYLDAAAVGSPPAALAPVADSIRGLAGRQVQHEVLPVEAISGVAGDQELYRVVDADMTKLVGDVFRVEQRRIRVQVLNGVGAPGIAQLVQPLLVGAGGRLTLSGNADRFDYTTTQVVYYDDDRLADAQAIREAIGVGEVVKSLTGLDVVDVTVVVGADFTTAHPGG
jgi:hypothetical protein